MACKTVKRKIDGLTFAWQADIFPMCDIKQTTCRAFRYGFLKSIENRIPFVSCSIVSVIFHVRRLAVCRSLPARSRLLVH